jgi:hypothetical protein
MSHTCTSTPRDAKSTQVWPKGTTHFKNVNRCWNTKITFYLETPGGQISNLYFNVVHFFNTSVN